MYRARFGRLIESALKGRDQRPSAAVVPVLAKVDSLPSPQGQSTFFDGHEQTAAEHARLHVCGHIVGAFNGMDERLVFRYDAIQYGLHIDSNVGIRVLIDRQRSRRMKQEEMQESNRNGLCFGDER